MTAPIHNPTCFANHMGLMACEARFLRGAVDAIRSGLWQPRADIGDGTSDSSTTDRYGRPLYTIVGDGVATLRLDGPMAKAAGKYASASTVTARRAIRAAVADPKVGSILMVVDSPGGYVAGTQDLADDVAAANDQKPVVAYIEDLGASAAYWVASQAGKVYANSGAFVGSIGVFAVVQDSSKAAELAGVKVHLISTGPLKGAGADGTPVTDEMLAAWQVEVDATMAQFSGAVRGGRGMTAKQLDAVTTGGVWPAKESIGLGLIDGIRPLDAVIAGMPKPRRPRT